MKNKIYLKSIAFIFLIFFFSSPAQAFYKKKVLVGQVNNPDKWEKSYHPGNIIKELLGKRLISQNRIQMISLSENSRRIIDESNSSSGENYMEPDNIDSRKTIFSETDVVESPNLQMKKTQQETAMSQIDEYLLWPSKLGEKSIKPNYTEIKGKIIKFIPDKNVSSAKELSSLQSKNWENAEIHLYIELVQNRSGRIIAKKTFKIFSNSGTQPFSMEDSSFQEMNNSSSSMNIALNSLIHKLESFIHNKLDSLPLEGEIISTKTNKLPSNKDEKKFNDNKILINIGTSNGVRIGDRFKVDSVSLKLNDLYTSTDLGDVYVNIGVIQIIQVWDGTAIAKPIAGKNFETGFLVKSYALSRNGDIDFHNRTSILKKEIFPWWDFHLMSSDN
jgi:hypothetical protein